MRADLHLHSRYSDRSADWLFRRFDFPDSYSQPKELYARLHETGMDLVTLTDHNRIDGCLEIADLPGVFISEEVTTYFPADRCKVHLLVWNLSEAQHREISTSARVDFRSSALPCCRELAARRRSPALQRGSETYRRPFRAVGSPVQMFRGAEWSARSTAKRSRPASARQPHPGKGRTPGRTA